MLITGICGQTGAGKSTLANMLSKRGLGQNLEVDAIGHEILCNDSIKEQLLAAFGDDITDDAGNICRRGLGKKAFVDESAIEKLNAIMHPAMIAAVKHRIAEAEMRGDCAIIVNAALLFSMGLDKLCHKLVYVCTSPEVRFERLVYLRNWTEDSAKERLFAQDEDPEREDIVRITNNGTEADLATAADALAKTLLESRI